MYTILTYSYLLLPFSVFISRKKWNSLDVLLIGLYGLIVFTFLFVDVNNVPVQFKRLYITSYTSIEYLFFALFIFLNIENKIVKKIIAALSFSFFLFQCIYYLNTKTGRIEFDSIPVGIETILLFIYLFIFFYENFKNPKTDFIYNHHCFWLAVGILIYLGGAFFFYILANHIGKEDLDKYWDLTYIAEILKNLFFAIAIFQYRPRSSFNKLKQESKMPYLDMN